MDTQQPNWATFKKDLGAYRLQQNNTYQGTGPAAEATDDLNAAASKTTAANQRTGKASIHTINALPSRASITTNNLSLASAAAQQQQQHFIPSQQLMQAATTSLQKNLEDILQRSGSGRSAVANHHHTQ